MLWDQISATRDEMTAWLDNTVTKLEGDSDNFADSVSVRTHLQKYKVSMNDANKKFMLIQTP